MHCPSRRGNANTFKGFVETSCQSPQFPQHSYRISGLDQEPVNPPTVGNATLSPVGVENPACVNGPVSRDSPDFWTCHHHPPHLPVLLRLAQVSVTPGTHPRNPGVLPQEYTTKKHTRSHLFHHHLKEREGNLCKVLTGAGEWWWLH